MFSKHISYATCRVHDDRYGNDPNNPYTWDAVKLRGCFCDEDWQGADCSERVCPYGDDPNTHDDVDEVR